MKRLLLILTTLLFTNHLLTQDGVKIYDTYHYNGKFLMYSIKSNDTIYWYTPDSIMYQIHVENDTLEVFYQIKDDSTFLVFKRERRITEQLLRDGRCNGITSSGDRCKRTAKEYYCWQHD